LIGLGRLRRHEATSRFKNIAVSPVDELAHTEGAIRMTIFRKGVVTLPVLVTLSIPLGVLASPATAQSRTTVTVGQPITTSTLVTVSLGETFEAGGVHLPPCPKGTSFLATAVQAAPYNLGSNVVSQKWAVSVHVVQLAPNGSFSPYLTAFANGLEQASTSIAGGQPLSIDEDNNVLVHLLGSAAATSTAFAVHVTGYCGVPFVTP
jgi:hypothetical protein